MKDDNHYINHALNLARQGQGIAGANPSVGCVIVRDGHVLATAHTAQNGRPHAETSALAQLDNAQDTTVYVSLEPCAHEGETPSCAKALVKAGVKRVVIGAVDPDPRTAGMGIEILKENGVEVCHSSLILPLLGEGRTKRK